MFPFFMETGAFALFGPPLYLRGGIQEGVLLGFWQGNKLNDEHGYLTHGTNKKVFYKIFNKVDEIDEPAIVKLLKEAVKVDNSLTKTQRQKKT